MDIKLSTKISLGVVTVVIICSFILSYTAIRELAIANGIAPNLASLFPVIIDGAMIVFAVALLEGQMQYDKRPFAIVGLVGLYVAISIGFNVAHSNGTFIGNAIAVIISFTVFASFEVALWQIKQVMQSKREDLQLQLQNAKSENIRLQNEFNNEIREKQHLLDIANGKLEVLDTLERRWNAMNSDYQVVVQKLAGEFETAKQAAELTTMDYSKFTRKLKELNGVSN